MFNLIYKEITKPDLYVYLYQNTERLLENIKKRGRVYEQNIESDYLKKIHDGYISFIKTQENLNLLIIDVSEIDFVNNPIDYNFIIEKIKSNWKKNYIFAWLQIVPSNLFNFNNLHI